MDICPNCHVGHLRPRRILYLSSFEGTFVTAPDVPGWLCDACGELSYDEVTLKQIDMLLGVDADLEPGRHPRSRRPTTSEERIGLEAMRRRA